DYNVARRLYFEELTLERVLDIWDLERAMGIVVSMGGQIPNNLALPLHHEGIHIIGTSPQSIDQAEDRKKFSALLEEVGVEQPRWCEAKNMKEAVAFVNKVGYPVLVRPSYVLSGAAMNVAYREDSLVDFLSKATEMSREHPVVLSEFISRAKE